ncbi:SAV_915 family protein [Streptomyces sp. NPDC005181]|uniref:SAV_915 family protein n=1 Tax=Streptomyces sp. NPDC005181 TaxID=3156869 RepID=UPI0033B7102D
MSDCTETDDPEPLEPVPAGLLFVPVRPGPSGVAARCTARFFRTPLGGRTAVGFTSVRQLTATLGAGQSWIRLSEPALRALAAPLGITDLTVDPRLTAQPPMSGSRERHWSGPYPQHGPTAVFARPCWREREGETL